jgi:hypothetical protein
MTYKDKTTKARKRKIFRSRKWPRVITDYELNLVKNVMPLLKV